MTAATLLRRAIRRLSAVTVVLALALATTAAPGASPATVPARISYRVVIDAPADLRATLEQGLDLVRWQELRRHDRGRARSPDARSRRPGETGGGDRRLVLGRGGHRDRARRRAGCAADPHGHRASRRADARDERARPRHGRGRHRRAGRHDRDREGAERVAASRRRGFPTGDVGRSEAQGHRRDCREPVRGGNARPQRGAGRSRCAQRRARRRDRQRRAVPGRPPGYPGAAPLRRLARAQLQHDHRRRALFRGALEQFIRRLNGVGYFSSVQARIDADPAHADDAAIDIRVIEAPPKRLEGGLFFSTDTKVPRQHPLHRR